LRRRGELQKKRGVSPRHKTRVPGLGKNTNTGKKTRTRASLTKKKKKENKHGTTY